MNKINKINNNCMLICIFLLILSCVSHKYPSTSWVANSQNNNYFELSGRIKIKYQNKSYYSNFILNKTNSLTIMKLNTPLGNTLGQICIDAFRVVINDYKNNVKYYTSSNINEIITQMIGYEVPLNDLPLWIVGQYNPNFNVNILNDNELIQDGWKVTRLIDENKNPINIELIKDQLYIKITFDKFNTLKRSSIVESNCKQLINF